MTQRDDSALTTAYICELAAYILATIVLSYWTHWTVGVVIWAVLFAISAREARRKAKEGTNAE